MDRRDDRTWVVIELTRAGEQRAEEGTLAKALREALHVQGDFPVFTPSTVYEKNGRRAAIHLMEGYVFVASGLAETQYFSLEQDCPYVKRVLSQREAHTGMRVLSTLPDSAVEDMRRQLQSHIATDIQVGMDVRVTEGVYGNLPAKVLDIEGQEASILIELRSLKVITTLPRVFLDPTGGVPDEF